MDNIEVPYNDNKTHVTNRHVKPGRPLGIEKRQRLVMKYGE